jgi:hypothetical protein
MLLVACGSAEPSSLATTGPGVTAAPPSGQSTGGAPGGTAEGSGGPGESSAPAESSPPSSGEIPVESEEPSSSEAPSASVGPADACSGSDDNRTFFATFAATVDWPVLCAVLPAQWHVTSGSYRHTGGGYLEIGYARPDGATLTLKEGTCRDSDGCVLSGTDDGDASLGSMAGTFVTLDRGGFAIVVDRGASPSWLLTAEGLGAAKTRSFGAAFVPVGG